MFSTSFPHARPYVREVRDFLGKSGLNTWEFPSNLEFTSNSRWCKFYTVEV